MQSKVIISLWLGSLILTATTTGILVKNYYTKPIPNNNVVVTTPVQSPVIPTSPSLSCELVRSELWKYQNDMPTINVVILEQTRTKVDVMVDGALYQRKFLTEVSIPLVQAESSNWKFTVGATVATAAIISIGYGAVKLYDRFK
jgi:hypothetical protein